MLHETVLHRSSHGTGNFMGACWVVRVRRGHFCRCVRPWAGCENWNCDVPTKTWRELVAGHVIDEIACHTQDRTHGYCYGVRVAAA